MQIKYILYQKMYNTLLQMYFFYFLKSHHNILMFLRGLLGYQNLKF